MAQPEEVKSEETELSPLELMRRRNGGMQSEESVAYGRSFKPRPTDVFVTTYPKCGTTWVTQICHCLRSIDCMDFDEITEVVPWDILALDCGQDLDADQVGEPRVFKSHERAGDIAKGAKYIHVCRRPEDAFVSFHRFLPALAGLPDGAISAEQFLEAVFGGVSHSGGIWDFFVEWWERREDPDVLWLCYEDLKEDFEGQVCRIARFMDIALDDELFRAVKEKSSFAYMATHAHQFDDHWLFATRRDSMGFPQDYVYNGGASKVRAGGGTLGEGAKLPQAVSEALAQRWDISVRAKTGFESYDDLRRAVAQL